jgi:sulfite dehydrogenase (cytochrome) subunit B
MMKHGMICLIAAVGLSASALGADKKSITLPPDNAMATLREGPGVEVARANCVACHSTDYIVRQRPASAEQWNAEVKKMVGVFGAPISDADAKVIAEYLASAYTPTKAMPPSTSTRRAHRGNADRPRKPAAH